MVNTMQAINDETGVVYGDTSRKGLVLSVILYGSLLIVGWAEIYVIIVTLDNNLEKSGISIQAITLIFLFFVLLFVLYKRGSVRLTSYLLIASYYVGTTYSVAIWGIELPTNLLMYSLVITITSILLGNLYGFVVTAIILGTLLIFGYEEVVRSLPPTWNQQSIRMEDIIFYGLILVSIMLVSWLSNRETEKSLQRALFSERLLEKERDQLEVRVQERTDALKILQAERISELYRFAEFGRLSSGIFHDLMNPLSAVSMNIESIGNEHHSDISSIKDNLKRTVDASKKMSRFMDALKRQIKTSVCDEYFNLRSIIEDAVLLLRHKAITNNVVLEIRTLDDVYIHQNPIEFQQVIVNLLSNAIDAYTTIDNRLNKSVVLIGLLKFKNSAVVQVKDSGVGMSDETMERMFDPFFSTKLHTGGSGIGLSTTKRIIEKNFKGIIKAESVPGQGSIFTVTIPISNNYEHTKSL